MSEKDVLAQEPGSPPPQEQEERPGREHEMTPRPDVEPRSSGRRLFGRAAIITGGDSGIGRAVAVAFAREGADVGVIYLEEHEDARETQRLVESHDRRCLLAATDVGDETAASEAVRDLIERLGHLEVLVNNAAEQQPQERLEDISREQLERTFRTNIFSMFYVTKAALPHLREGSSIINTTSVTAYKGSAHLIDYSSTKGAIVTFTRSLALALANRGIRVNGVAPGPIWTPLIPSTFSAQRVGEFGQDTTLGRAGQPNEIAPSFVFLASDDASYMTGQVLHANGGTIVNG